MKKPIIQLRDIQKLYGKDKENQTLVLKSISLRIYSKDFIAITGPSGSGKSTLMNILGLLDTPYSGTYILNGTDVAGLTQDQLSYLRNKEIGFVFQSFNLLPRLTVLENITLPAIYAGIAKKEREEKAKELLKKLGLENKFYSKPNQLSGGQQQRAAIARALINNPNIILADEPTGNLDTKSGEDVINILSELYQQGKTIILITHEKDIAKKAKKIIRLKDGEII